jgi:hypothetical protein
LALLCASVSLLVLSKSSAGNLSTNTTLWILPWSLTFIKDTTTNMDSYFSHSPDSSSSMNIWQYGSKIWSIIAASTWNHRFTISDMLGGSFVITIQSTALNSTWWNTISANNIWYTGTTRLWTWKTLTAAPIYSTDIWTAPVTFVSRENNSGLSLFSQEIILKVNIPPAQKPWSYTWSITFTY